jgi:hypothetical protein
VTSERFLDVLAPSGIHKVHTWVEGAMASRESLLAPWRFVPGLWTLRHYGRQWLRGDLLAGVTVAAYLVRPVQSF